MILCWFLLIDHAATGRLQSIIEAEGGLTARGKINDWRTAETAISGINWSKSYCWRITAKNECNLYYGNTPKLVLFFKVSMYMYTCMVHISVLLSSSGILAFLLLCVCIVLPLCVCVYCTLIVDWISHPLFVCVISNFEYWMLGVTPCWVYPQSFYCVTLFLLMPNS